MMGIREDKVAISEPTDVITGMTAITETGRRIIGIMIGGSLKGSIIVVNAGTPAIKTGANGNRMSLKAEVEAMIVKYDALQNILKIKTANQKLKLYPLIIRRN